MVDVFNTSASRAARVRSDGHIVARTKLSQLGAVENLSTRFWRAAGRMLLLSVERAAEATRVAKDERSQYDVHIKTVDREGTTTANCGDEARRTFAHSQLRACVLEKMALIFAASQRDATICVRYQRWQLIWTKDACH
ncbi:hypothetical protein [Bradyrhizobium macuxiense]|uniref:hypothetical protein n=1 Tax=Bradyrhizobium macuxiense TaxID=1755647 RepID=UPI0011BEC116|nr:hypothetical protein [Bradyrhizobium macuxiense]